MKSAAIMAIMAVLMLTVATAAALQNSGAEKIQLDGGKKGSIAFPHHQHQEAIGDCDVCHSVFPKESESIKKLKAQKELKAKQVMNKTCLKCHRERKTAGEKTGPTNCSGCHSN